MSKKNLTLFFSFTFSFAAIAVPAPKLILPSDRADVEIKNFVLTETEKGSKKLEVESPAAKLFREENLAGLVKPRSKIWNESAGPYLIESNEGIIDTLAKKIEMTGACVVTSPQLFQLRTEDLFYNDKNRTIASEQDLLLDNKINSSVKNSFEVRGNAFFADLGKNEYFINNGVSAVHFLGPERTTITAQTAKIFLEENKSILEKNVTFHSKEAQLKADRLTIFLHKEGAKKEGIERAFLEAYQGKKIETQLNGFSITSNGMNIFPSEKNEIEKLEAVGSVFAKHNSGVEIFSDTLSLENRHSANPKVILNGNVLIKSQGKTAKCQEAEYFPESGNVRLRKLASIETNNETITGEQIDYSFKESKVEVKKASGKINKETLGL